MSSEHTTIEARKWGTSSINAAAGCGPAASSRACQRSESSRNPALKGNCDEGITGERTEVGANDLGWMFLRPWRWRLSAGAPGRVAPDALASRRERGDSERDKVRIEDTVWAIRLGPRGSSLLCVGTNSEGSSRSNTPTSGRGRPLMPPMKARRHEDWPERR